MSFEVLPILDQMLNFYQLPKDMDRFSAYMKILNGDSKADMQVPVSFYNPMGKEHVGEKIQELIDLNAEAIAKEVIDEVNRTLASENLPTFKMVINLADDLKGAWTSKYTCDYDAKFKLNAFLERRFCVPVFWSSEVLSEKIIRDRITQACYRTVFQIKKGTPKTLEEHINQEAFAYQTSKINPNDTPLLNIDSVISFYSENKNSTDYSLIFYFLYGDAASEELGFKKYGISQANAGSLFAPILYKFMK
jgi:hypothetical protein